MDRDAFHREFKCAGPAVLPVIHVRDQRQASRNVALALGEGAQGVFLINHDFSMPELLPILRRVRQDFPRAWLGVNFLGVSGRDAFPVLGDLQRDGVQVDAYWADDARIDETAAAGAQAEAAEIDAIRRDSGWQGLYFGGTAFKKQRPVSPARYRDAAAAAAACMDVVTTSGVATGQATDLSKLQAFRSGVGDAPLAVASGISPANAPLYLEQVDAFLVATGINHPGDFYNIDPTRLRRLLAASRRALLPAEDDGDRAQRWYLSRMAPSTRGAHFAWLDPSSVYVDARSFHALLDDLMRPFDASQIDLVAGPDAMGFVLGAALAARLGKGFLTLRKAGKVSVESDRARFTNYTGREQELEMRKPAFAPGTRVLLVDQWVETGGTIAGAIELVTRQGGVVAGIAAVCIEDNASTATLRQRYTCASAVLPGSALQAQCNAQRLDSFEHFSPEATFPDLDG